MITQLSITQHEMGTNSVITLIEPVELVSLDLFAANAVLSRVGDNLVFNYDDGFQTSISGFFSVFSSGNLPDFDIEGYVVTGEDFFAALGATEIMPAAGDVNQSIVLGSGVSIYDVVSQLAGGVEALGSSSEAGRFNGAFGEKFDGSLSSLLASNVRSGAGNDNNDDDDVPPPTVVEFGTFQDGKISGYTVDGKEGNVDTVFISKGGKEVEYGVIQGGAGNDTITGTEYVVTDVSEMDAIIDGGDGDDTISIDKITNKNTGWSDGLTIYGGEGNDTIKLGTAESVMIYGDTENLYDGDVGGNDTLSAESLSWSGMFNGDAMNLYGGSQGGDDTIHVTTLVDKGNSVSGDGYQLHSNARGGNDTISVDTMHDGTISGDGLLHDSAVGGNDTISVGIMENGYIYGDGYGSGSTSDAKGGDDTITVGTMKNGDIYGDAEKNLAQGGNDTISIGTMENGNVDAGGGNDIVRVGAFANGNIRGGEGFDFFIGSDIAFAKTTGFEARISGNGSDTIDMAILESLGVTIDDDNKISFDVDQWTQGDDGSYKYTGAGDYNGMTITSSSTSSVSAFSVDAAAEFAVVEDAPVTYSFNSVQMYSEFLNTSSQFDVYVADESDSIIYDPTQISLESAMNSEFMNNEFITTDGFSNDDAIASIGSMLNGITEAVTPELLAQANINIDAEGVNLGEGWKTGETEGTFVHDSGLTLDSTDATILVEIESIVS